MRTFNAATYNYSFKTKKEWRKQMWNDIKSRLLTPAKETVVLYLPGPENLDLKEAVQRGFLPSNLIAIERDKGVCAELRKQGVNCISEDALTVIDAWPRETMPDVVFMDFACQITNEVYCWIRNHTVYGGSVIWAFNALCGREARSPVVDVWAARGVGELKHRFKRMKAIDYLGINEESKKGVDSNVISIGSPSYRTYISTSNQRFDSVVFGGDSSFALGTTPSGDGKWNSLDRVGGRIEKSKNFGAIGGEGLRTMLIAQTKRTEKARRKIGAALAVRTMRGGKKRREGRPTTFLMLNDAMNREMSHQDVTNTRKVKALRARTDRLERKHTLMVNKWKADNQDVIACTIACTNSCTTKGATQCQQNQAT